MQRILRLLGTRYGIALVLAVVVFGIVGALRGFSGSRPPPPAGLGAAPATASALAASAEPNDGDDSVDTPPSPPDPVTSPGAATPDTVALKFATAWLHHTGVSAQQWWNGLKPFATVALLCCGGTSAFFLGGLGGDADQSSALGPGCGTGGPIDLSRKLPRIAQLGEEQMRNAAIIISVGQKMNVPPRGWVIAIGTALQESVLTNLPNLGSRNDHDSLGLFQQRPRQGWGTAEQIMDPQYSSRKFYEKLLTISGWLTMPLTDAAQAVQSSAFPDAYAKHEPLATEIVNLLANGAARAVGALNALRCVLPGEIAASGWTV